MIITPADIEGMASPGWGERGLDVLEDFEEGGFDEVEELVEELGEDEEEEKEKVEEEEESVVRFDGQGHREGMSTFEICERLKNGHASWTEREFSEILTMYPRNGKDYKILLWLASGFSYEATAAGLARSYKTVTNAARRLRQFRDHGSVRLLPPNRVEAGAELLEPLPKSRAGRKPRRGEITTAEIISFDLFGDPIQPRKPRKPRKAGARRPRVCPPVPGQLSLFDMAA
jgi:hypothetical protein